MKKEKITVFSVYLHGKLLWRGDYEAGAKTIAKRFSGSKITRGFKLV